MLVTTLDALYPGTPDQLVAACRAAGAAGALGYVWHGDSNSHDTGGWTQAHWDRLRAEGLIAAPIASVAPTPGAVPTPGQIVAAAHSFSFARGPLVQDMESPANLPSRTWWNGAISAYRAAGFSALKYGNNGDVGTYNNGDGWWEAFYVQHTVTPVPNQLRPNGVGWQYADQVQINGIEYDVSVFDAAVFAVQEAGMRVIQASSSTTPNPNPVYVTDSQTKRWISNGDEQNFYLRICGQASPDQITQYIVDRLPAIASPGVNNPPSFGAAAIDLLEQRDQINELATAPPASGGGLTPAQDAALQDTHATVKAALKGGA